MAQGVMAQTAQYVSRVANETYGLSRRIMPEQPWWLTLDPAFHKFPDDFYLDLPTQLLVNGTACVDKAIRTLSASVVLAAALPQTLRDGALARDFAQWGFYQELADQRNPALFFPRPQQAVTMRSRLAGRLDYQPSEGVVEVLAFESRFEPVNPALREDYLRHEHNRTAWAQHWRHDGPPRPTICIVHGFIADPYWLNARFLALPRFYQMGYNVLLYTLPFHGPRSGPNAPFSGHGYFSYGLSHANETIAHAVHDFRLFLDYLEMTGVPRFGVTGISLGGYTAALLAGVENRLAFAVPNVPVASLPDLIMEWFPLGTFLRIAMRATGTDLRTLRHANAVASPLTYPPLLPRERLLLIGGAGDRFAPPKHTRLIWDHWNHPRLHWFPGNHLIHLDQGRYLLEMEDFLHKIGFDQP
ncbi:MAG: alpha/beta hydrolase [Moraxellaceae bacterium]|jgi:pimeloyl-ACP methyl ester carboxylesterase|nr:alpha/beta hydrolase [Moraxellaceae bacterium]